MAHADPVAELAERVASYATVYVPASYVDAVAYAAARAFADARTEPDFARALARAFAPPLDAS